MLARIPDGGRLREGRQCLESASTDLQRQGVSEILESGEVFSSIGRGSA
jgi:hypothetical protein